MVLLQGIFIGIIITVCFSYAQGLLIGRKKYIALKVWLAKHDIDLDKLNTADTIKYNQLYTMSQMSNVHIDFGDSETTKIGFRK